MRAALSDTLELLVAYDADDPETERAAIECGARRRIGFGERLGWAGNNTYFAHLFAEARGEWIVPFGDDGEMLTDGWDEIVRRQERGVLHLMGGVSGHNVFPIVHRDVLLALPWMKCPSPHQDTWLTDVAAGAGLLHAVQIWITEHREIDETRPAQRHGYRTEEYYSEPMQRLRRQDIEALRLAFGVNND